MVTVNKIGGQTVTRTAEFIGLSTDAKPISTEIKNGSSFFEFDTGDVYFYKAETQTWIKL